MDKSYIILQDLRNSNLNSTLENYEWINQQAVSFLREEINDTSVNILENILIISNILYNDTDLEMLPLDNETYDTLMERYRAITGHVIIGAEPINFNFTTQTIDTNDREIVPAISFIERKENELFPEVFDFSKRNYEVDYQTLYRNPLINVSDVTNMTMTAKQRYPNLVGTLNKCKFVLNTDARKLGVEDDSNVKILERDFFQVHLRDGIINPTQQFTVVVELKYDGESVVADIENGFITQGNGRGDTASNVACDYTPFLKGYVFPKAMNFDRKIGAKFEAIMMEPDLNMFNQLRGREYKNCRSGIVGLTGRADSAQFRDLITLIPLAVEVPGVEMNRIEEIEFMNNYLVHDGQKLRYAVITGNYIEVLYQIKQFKEEADLARNWLPFMYDGIVVSYLDKDIRDRLGRESNINLYSMAVKFNPLKKQTIFRGYDYTVGQDGSITPMIHYDAVEFYGTIHTKSSGHSLARFLELNLSLGDMIEVQYTNDVMPYVNKPCNTFNDNNPNPPIPFIDHCPICNSKLEITKSGKTARCANLECKGRSIARMANMMDKLQLKDFAESTIQTLDKYHLCDIINLDVSVLSPLIGEVNTQKFVDRMNELKRKPIFDFDILGALGFDSVGSRKWKLICNLYSMPEIFELWKGNLLEKTIIKIKGIGPGIAASITNQMEFFERDLLYIIMDMDNIVYTKGMSFGKKIRWSGLRDSDLNNTLLEMGHQSDMNASVTKDTDFLIVSDSNYSSGKTKKANDYNIPIVIYEDFVNNMDKYLN